MARFFPVRSQCQFDTPGERRFAERLEKLLEDDYLCWSNVPVGPKARYPDFVVLHPRRGILVHEVKDWKLATIQSIDPRQGHPAHQQRPQDRRQPDAEEGLCMNENISVLFFTRTWPNTMGYKIPCGYRYLWRTRPRAVRLVDEGMLCTSSVVRLIHRMVSNYS